MNASERIDELIAGIADWRGKTFAGVRKAILAADTEIIEEWKWMGSPVWSHDGIVAVANVDKNKVKLPFPTGRTSQILTSSSTRASKATQDERSIFSRVIRLMSALKKISSAPLLITII